MKIQPSDYMKKCLRICFDAQVASMLDTYACIVTFEKGTHVIRVGEVVSSFYFIIYGIVRGYYIDDEGHEVTKCFEAENCFFGSECYRTNQSASFYVECLEECKCLRLPYSLVKKLISLDQQVGSYIQNLYLEEVGKLEHRTRDLLLMTAEERYISFCKDYPSLQRRVQLRYIASYIGIQPASMSRIRKKLKNQI